MKLIAIRVEEEAEGVVLTPKGVRNVSIPEGKVFYVTRLEAIEGWYFINQSTLKQSIYILIPLTHRMSQESVSAESLFEPVRVNEMHTEEMDQTPLDAVITGKVKDPPQPKILKPTKLISIKDRLQKEKFGRTPKAVTGFIARRPSNGNGNTPTKNDVPKKEWSFEDAFRVAMPEATPENGTSAAKEQGPAPAPTTEDAFNVPEFDPNPDAQKSISFDGFVDPESNSGSPTGSIQPPETNDPFKDNEEAPLDNGAPKSLFSQFMNPFGSSPDPKQTKGKDEDAKGE